MPHPIGLTDLQMKQVLGAARLIPQQWRSRFLENTMDYLLPSASAISDEAVAEAIHEVASKFHVNLSANICLECNGGNE